MTLLFFFRSPAGNTDTGQGSDTAPFWDYDEAKKPKRKTKEEKRAERLAAFAVKEAAREQVRKKKRRQEEEGLLMLFMHEFDGYDD